MTLTQMYEKAKSQSTPAAAFIKEVAEVTKKGELAVRRWIAGDTTPDALTQQVLAQHFNTTPDALFPKNKPTPNA